jgi:hypothetical protein
VPCPVPTVAGEWFVRIEVEAGRGLRRCVLLEWVEGEPVSPPAAFVTSGVLERVGEVVARLHQHSSGFRCVGDDAANEIDGDRLVGCRSPRRGSCPVPIMPSLPLLRRRSRRALSGAKTSAAGPRPRHPFVAPPGKVAIFVARRITYVDRPGYVPERPVKESRAKKPREAPPALDRKYLAAARELRDRYLEHVNAQLIGTEGKYDVSRQMGEGRTMAARTAEAISCDAPKALPVLVAPAT